MDSIDLTEDIAREILLHLRIRNPSKFFAITKILQTLLANILKDPLDTKFHKIKMQNPKIYESITTQIECINLLEILGFKEMADVVSDSGLQQMMVISQNDVLDTFQNI
jgi:hypothetical protein